MEAERLEGICLETLVTRLPDDQLLRILKIYKNEITNRHELKRQQVLMELKNQCNIFEKTNTDNIYNIEIELTDNTCCIKMSHGIDYYIKITVTYGGIHGHSIFLSLSNDQMRLNNYKIESALASDLKSVVSSFVNLSENTLTTMEAFTNFALLNFIPKNVDI